MAQYPISKYVQLHPSLGAKAVGCWVPKKMTVRKHMGYTLVVMCRSDYALDRGRVCQSTNALGIIT